ncbi:MAG: hypothetical protein ACXVB9_18720 [Bdellovibrionota bacterium]
MKNKLILCSIPALLIVGLTLPQRAAKADSASCYISNSGSWNVHVSMGGMWVTGEGGDLQKIAATAKDLVAAGICKF